MATFAEIRTTIGSETLKTSLVSEIGEAVKSAIRLRQNERFWFNETRSYTFATVADDDTYTLAASGSVSEFLTIDRIEAQIGSVWHELERVDQEEMTSLKHTARTGQPLCWCYFGDEVQIYPTPSDVYTLRVTGHFKFAELSAGTDTNAWLTHGYDMIKEAAKAIFYANIVRNEGMAATSRGLSDSFLQQLRAESSRRRGTGKIKPWC